MSPNHLLIDHTGEMTTPLPPNNFATEIRHCDTVIVSATETRYSIPRAKVQYVRYADQKNRLSGTVRESTYVCVYVSCFLQEFLVGF
jgi:hypothetical protein